MYPLYPKQQETQPQTPTFRATPRDSRVRAVPDTAATRTAKRGPVWSQVPVPCDWIAVSVADEEGYCLLHHLSVPAAEERASARPGHCYDSYQQKTLHPRHLSSALLERPTAALTALAASVQLVVGAGRYVYNCTLPALASSACVPAMSVSARRPSASEPTMAQPLTPA